MRKVWNISSLHLKEFFKSPGALALMLVLPLLFSLIFGGIAVGTEQNKPVVNVVVQDGKISQVVFDLLARNDQFEWKRVSKQQANENVSKQKTAAAVVIPSNSYERIVNHEPLFEIILRNKTDDYLALVPHLEGTANLIIRSYQVTKEVNSDAFPDVIEAVAASKNVKVEKRIVQKDDKDTSPVEMNLMIVGFAIMFMMFGLSGAASTILDERIGGTWGRLMTTPASKWQISLGYMFAYFLMGWIQFAVLMISMKFIYDTNWGNVIYLIPFASLVILCVVGFGLMIAGLVKTKQQAGAIGAVLIVSTCMLGGVYWSIEFVPEVMQKIALAVPQSWAMSGFKEIISGSLHVKTLLYDTLALSGFTVAFFFIGLRGITYK